MSDRYIKDGKVAVLVSYGYGAGWSTWNWDHPNIIFDPFIVECVLEHNQLEGDAKIDHLDVLVPRVEEYGKKAYPGAYLGGVWGLDVTWVPVGEKFRIHEYDGSERVILESEHKWSVA